VNRINHGGDVEPVQARKIREWNSLDTALYDHFEKKLDVAIEKYGRSRMQSEVAKLRSQLREVEEKCVDVSIEISHVTIGEFTLVRSFR